ncbi:MAG TPA: redoxin domain-containing protein [Ktedonobacterales bacterium]|nr:redoxin domain-containing protein [Ktedonobacterales bacterium]
MTNAKITTPPARRQAPRCGALAPAFTLPDATRPADADLVRLRAWRQRRPVLLALLPEPAGAQSVAWLRALAARDVDLEDARAVTLAIVGGDREAVRTLWRQADVSFPLLADATGETLAAYLGADATRPTLALVNRYNTLLALLPATGPDAAPDLDAALREFAFAEQEDCACGIPEWPQEE